ncbi:MAG: CcmD family protein [Bradymonadaceae bacterium]
MASAAAVWTCLAGVAGNAFAGDELPPAAGETTIPGGWLALVSYLALWIGVGAYLLYLGRRYTALADRLEALESRIDAVFDDDTEDRTTGE